MDVNRGETQAWAPVRTFLHLLRTRRTRRFGLGMQMSSGPLTYTSPHPGVPLSEAEEALLAFAACGITGYALADLVYAHGQGGTIMAGLAVGPFPAVMPCRRWRCC